MHLFNRGTSKVFTLPVIVEVRAEAVNALGKCGEPSDIPFIEKAKNTDSPRNILKRAAQRAIETMKSLQI